MFKIKKNKEILTTIRITKNIRKRLQKNKLVEGEIVDSIINRMIDCHEKIISNYSRAEYLKHLDNELRNTKG